MAEFPQILGAGEEATRPTGHAEQARWPQGFWLRWGAGCERESYARTRTNEGPLQILSVTVLCDGQRMQLGKENLTKYLWQVWERSQRLCVSAKGLGKALLNL